MGQLITFSVQHTSNKRPLQKSPINQYQLVKQLVMNEIFLYQIAFKRSLKLKRFLTHYFQTGKAAHATTTVFLSYCSSMVAACCPSSGTPSFFSAMTLLAGRKLITSCHCCQSGFSIINLPPRLSVLWRCWLRDSKGIWPVPLKKFPEIYFWEPT